MDVYKFPEFLSPSKISHKLGRFLSDRTQFRVDYLGLNPDTLKKSIQPKSCYYQIFYLGDIKKFN